MRSNHYRLQFITHHNDRFSYLDSARLALAGGCRWIQLRMKGVDGQLFEATAREVGALCREYGATFIIDDEVELAKRVGADGVHLGKEDMPVAEARAILGSEAIIGATVNSTEDILGHVHGTMPDYFGCGPFRFTTTKRRLAPTLGLDGYRAIMRQMHEAHISIPLVAIHTRTLRSRKKDPAKTPFKRRRPHRLEPGVDHPFLGKAAGWRQSGRKRAPAAGTLHIAQSVR